MSRIRLAGYTFATSLTFTVLSMVVGLIATPYILGWLGNESLGAFRALIDWLSYLALLELGLYGALLPLFNQAIADEDEPRQRATLRLGIRSYLKVSLLTLVVGAAAFPFVDSLVPVSGGRVFDLRVALAVGLSSALLLPFTPAKAFLEAAQRGYWVNLAGTVQGLLTVGLALTFAYAGYGVTGQVLATVIGQALFWTCAWVALRRSISSPTQGLVSEEVPSEVRAGLRRLNGPQFLGDVAGRISVHADNIVIGLLLGPAVVVPFFLTQRLCAIALSQLQSVGNASWAALGDLHARGESALFGARLVELTKLMGAIGVCGLVPVCLCNRVFIGLWIGPANYAGDLVTVLSALNALLFAVTSTWSFCLVATGRVRAVVPVALAQAALNLGLSVILTRKFGMVGPVAGTLASLALTLVWLPRVLRREFGVSALSLVWALARSLIVVGLPCGALGAYALMRRAPAGWLELVLAMAVSGVVLVLLCWALVLDRSERALWIARVRGLVAR